MPIPGTTQLPHLEEDLGALSVGLSPDDLREIELGLSSIQVHGARSTASLLAMTDDGAKLGTSSAGVHGMSPLPAQSAP